MGITKTLQFLRQVFKYTQDQVIPDKPRSIYAKIESGKQPIRLKDIEIISENYGMSINEFFAIYNHYDDNNQIANKLKELFQKTETPEIKNDIITQYKKLSEKKDKTANELRTYIAIKRAVAPKWTEISPISNSDLDLVFSFLNDKIFYGYYHYSLLLNVSIILDDERLKTLIKKMYPIQHFELRDSETKNYASNVFLNIITAKLYKKEYKNALEYIEQAEKIDPANMNYYFRFSLQYLKNLTLYIKTRNPNYYQKIYTFISLVYDIGDLDTANKLEEEVRELTEEDITQHENLPSNWIKEH